VRSAEPGRRALLDAGRTLLADADLPRLSVNAIVAAAGMAKGSFYQHWPARRDYLVALHRAFHDDLAEAVEAAMTGLNPGLSRLQAGVTAYLDGCLANPATKALLVQARTDANLGPEVAARNRAFAAMGTDDLAALGWDPVEPVATLLVAVVAEIALHELATGSSRADLRAAALRLISRGP
jgi:AcrR family transcriptional regulator